MAKTRFFTDDDYKNYHLSQVMTSGTVRTPKHTIPVYSIQKMRAGKKTGTAIKPH